MGEGTEELRNEEQLNRDIERTRMQLSQDVDELGNKVSPSQVIERRKQAARGRFASMRDKVMGPVQGAAGSIQGAAGSVQGGGQSLGQSVGQSVGGRTEGNPLAAGVIAFGAGMLIASLMPASRAEERLAQQGMDAVKEHGQPLMDEAKSMAGGMGEQLKESAAQGAQEVKSTAQESAQTLKDEGQSSAQSVREAGSSS